MKRCLTDVFVQWARLSFLGCSFKYHVVCSWLFTLRKLHVTQFHTLSTQSVIPATSGLPTENKRHKQRGIMAVVVFIAKTLLMKFYLGNVDRNVRGVADVLKFHITFSHISCLSPSVSLTVSPKVIAPADQMKFTVTLNNTTQFNRGLLGLF